MLIDDFFLGTKLYHKKIIKLLNPISNYLGVDQIGYATIDRSGKCFAIVSNYKMFEDSIERQGYKDATFFVHPDNMHNGFAFDNASADENYKNNLYTFMTKFNWHNSFIYAEKDQEGGYFALNFATTKDNFAIFSKLINESQTIKKLIRNLNKKIISTFNKDIQEKKMDFATLRGESFYTTKGRVFNEQLELEQQNKIKLLKDSGIFDSNDNNILAKIQLSPQEANCLKIYHSTHNIKKIARNLDLSTTTVTSCIEHLKDKLNCNNNNELFEKIEILELLGHIYL